MKIYFAIVVCTSWPEQLFPKKMILYASFSPEITASFAICNHEHIFPQMPFTRVTHSEMLCVELTDNGLIRGLWSMDFVDKTNEIIRLPRSISVFLTGRENILKEGPFRRRLITTNLQWFHKSDCSYRYTGKMSAPGDQPLLILDGFTRYSSGRHPLTDKTTGIDFIIGERLRPYLRLMTENIP